MWGFLYDSFKSYCDNVEVDKFGNIIGLKRPKPKEKLWLHLITMKSAFLVKSIDENGFIRFTNIGGIDSKYYSTRSNHSWEGKYLWCDWCKTSSSIDPEEAKSCGY